MRVCTHIYIYIYFLDYCYLFTYLSLFVLTLHRNIDLASESSGELLYFRIAQKIDKDEFSVVMN